MSSTTWIVASSGNGRVRHKLRNEEDLRPMCRVVGSKWRSADEVDIQALKSCPNCVQEEARLFERSIADELRAAESRIRFSEEIRGLADRLSRSKPFWPYPGSRGSVPFPLAFIDDDQREAFDDAIYQVIVWMDEAADCLDPTIKRGTCC